MGAVKGNVPHSSDKERGFNLNTEMQADSLNMYIEKSRRDALYVQELAKLLLEPDSPATETALAELSPRRYNETQVARDSD